MYCNARANGQTVEEGMTFSLLRCGQICSWAKTTTVYCLNQVFDTEGDNYGLVPQRGETTISITEVFWLK